MYDTRTPGALPFALDGTTTASYLWYTEKVGYLARRDPLGNTNEYAVPQYGQPNTSPQDVILAPNGTPWFFDATGEKIGHATTDGQIVEYNLGAALPAQGPDNLAVGPDGNIWFVGNGSTLTLGYVTSTGTVTLIALPFSTYASPTLAFGSDGNAWITTGNSIIRVKRSGAVLNVYNFGANYITRGPDGNVWVTENDAIATIVPQGNVIKAFPIYFNVPNCPPSNSCSRSIGAITTGSDGALWFAEGFGGIGRITTGGVYSEYQVFTPRTHPTDVSNNRDGNIWFVDSGAEKLGRVKIH